MVAGPARRRSARQRQPVDQSTRHLESSAAPDVVRCAKYNAATKGGAKYKRKKAKRAVAADNATTTATATTTTATGGPQGGQRLGGYSGGLKETAAGLKWGANAWKAKARAFAGAVAAIKEHACCCVCGVATVAAQCKKVPVADPVPAFMAAALECDVQGLPAQLRAQYAMQQGHVSWRGLMLEPCGVSSDGQLAHVCKQCHSALKRGNMPKHAIANCNWVGKISMIPELAALTAFERMLFSQGRTVRPHCTVWVKAGGVDGKTECVAEKECRHQLHQCRR